MAMEGRITEDHGSVYHLTLSVLLGCQACGLGWGLAGLSPHCSFFCVHQRADTPWHVCAGTISEA